ncbi:hypothetical protein ACFLYO_03395 [Chloroflexota bacterium]
MITREIVLQRFLAYLNREITLADLVDWAENAVMDANIAPDDAELLMEILGYLGAADSPGFELTWEVCYGFLTQLGTPVKVVPFAA